jgi:translocation and assembly module TamA
VCATRVLILILAAALSVRAAIADELEVSVTGIGEPALASVRAAVEPLRFVGVGRLSERRLRQMRRNAEKQAREAMRPFGYYQASASGQVIKSGERAWRLEVKVEPGPPVLIGEQELAIEGPGAEVEELLEWKAAWPLKPGKVLVQPDWERLKQQALNIAAENGYLLADFSRHQIRLDLERNRADLALVLDTGERAVMGNVRFHQAVVKPYIVENLPRFRKGDYYDAWIMERFRIDVWQSGYFTNIEIVEDRHLDESPPRVDVDVRLEPRKPNTYQSTVGIGSDTGPRVLFSWNRHLLSRNGDSFSLGTGWQQHNNEFFVRGNYRIPRDTPTRQFWVADALVKRENEDLKVRDDATDLLYRLGSADISDYSIRPGRLRVYDRRRGYRQVFETIYAQYLYESIDFRLDPDSPFLPLGSLYESAGRERLGRNIESLSFGVDYDIPFQRGQGFETYGVHNRGWAFISNEAWGSDEDFVQVYLSSRWNFLAGKRWKFLLRGEVGYTDADVNESQIEIEDTLVTLSVTDLPNLYRFKAGGSNSVRGYGFESLSNNNIGSNNIVTFSAEAEMKLFGDWSAAVFFDAGNAFNDWSEVELKRGVGVGVRWYTIAGAIRVDYAYGLDVPGDPWRLHFTIGTSLL